MGAPAERRLRRGDGGGENVFHWIARMRFVALALSCVERQFYAQTQPSQTPARATNRNRQFCVSDKLCL